MSGNRPSLPADRAFVVQFRAANEGSHDVRMGRVEHLTTGQTAHFRSWDGLRQFVGRTLVSVEDGPGTLGSPSATMNQRRNNR